MLTHAFYAEHTTKAPVFMRTDAEKLRDFIKSFITRGDRADILYKVEGGRIRPSKMLADSLASMLRGES